jgi:murein DD-endopeptidase MepM/ murein hydrolase activator NlpD
MIFHTRPGITKFILACVVLFLAQLACQANVDPNDPRLPASLNNMAIQFAALFQQLNLIPVGIILPPQITQINNDSANGTISISGLGKTYLDIKGSAYAALTGSNLPQGQDTPADKQTKIRLYLMQPHGCGQEPERGSLLAETTINDDRTWSFTYNLKPGAVVGATQVSEEKESGLSNLKVNIDISQILVVDKADDLQQVQYEIFQDEAPVIITGSSYPGACVVLENQDINYGRVGSASADATGKWQIQAPVHVGENKFKVFVEGFEEAGSELILRAFSLRMQWPFIEKDNSGKFIAPITAWFGKNDYHWNILHTFHDGIDIGAKENTPVHAVANGEVFFIQISSKDTSGGNMVFIDHGGWLSVYEHLSKITIDPQNPSQSKIYDPPIKVMAGDIIGLTGNTGCAGCGIHLHLSALRWAKGDRQKSLGGKPPSFPWNFGVLYNINPPKDTILGNNLNSNDLLQKCVSNFDFWDVDWSLIPINNPGSPSGTEFTTMGKSTACAIK